MKEGPTRKERTGISTRGDGPGSGCNHHGRSVVIQAVPQISGNSKEGDRIEWLEEISDIWISMTSDSPA